jgi:two-component system, NarL family, sensor histidine kinase UhpB
MLLGGAFTVWQARSAVAKEVDSSINLAVQLVTFAVTHNTETPYSPIQWLSQLNALQATRHLAIQLKAPSGQTVHIHSQTPRFTHHNKPPQWFVSLVIGTYPKVERKLVNSDGQQLSLIIEANPLDEITEVWQESVALFNILALLTLLSFLAVNLAFNAALKATSTIVTGLKIIEQGNYQHKLADFSIQEYGRIAKAINHLAEQLHISQQENRALTQHSLAIQEEERQHLAQELHDELGQSLTAIKLLVVSVGRDQANAAEATQAIVEVCDHLMAMARSMMRQLHPLVLSELGLRAGLEDLTNYWSGRTGLQLEFICSPKADALPQAVAIQLFRVVQEGLTNIIRHAQASTARIHLTITNGQLILSVCDNGQGCPSGVKPGFGLLGMRERIQSLGGQLRYYSIQPHGFSLEVNIPLPHYYESSYTH